MKNKISTIQRIIKKQKIYTSLKYGEVDFFNTNFPELPNVDAAWYANRAYFFHMEIEKNRHIDFDNKVYELSEISSNDNSFFITVKITKDYFEYIFENK